MFLGLLFVRKNLLDFFSHRCFGDDIVIIVLKFDPFLFWIAKNYRKQNISLDGNISFSFYQLIDLRNFLSDHSSKNFLRQSPLGEFLLEEFSWMYVFHIFFLEEINNYTVLWTSELSLLYQISYQYQALSLILRNSENPSHYIHSILFTIPFHLFYEIANFLPYDLYYFFYFSLEISTIFTDYIN